MSRVTSDAAIFLPASLAARVIALGFARTADRPAARQAFDQMALAVPGVVCSCVVVRRDSAVLARVAEELIAWHAQGSMSTVRLVVGMSGSPKLEFEVGAGSSAGDVADFLLQATG
jgi:hypothetical protein